MTIIHDDNVTRTALWQIVLVHRQRNISFIPRKWEVTFGMFLDEAVVLMDPYILFVPNGART